MEVVFFPFNIHGSTKTRYLYTRKSIYKLI